MRKDKIKASSCKKLQFESKSAVLPALISQNDNHINNPRSTAI